MRILHVADFGKSPNISGVFFSATRLADAQHLLGNDIHIISTRKISTIKSDNTSFCTSPRKFKNFLLSFKPQIIIFHSFYDFTHPAFARITRKLNIPYAVCLHSAGNPRVLNHRKFIKICANQLVFNRYLHKANALIYLTEEEQNISIFKKINPRGFIIPNGSQTIDRNIEKNSSHHINISFISRISSIKGINLLLNSISKIKQSLELQDVSFRLYGEILDKNFIKQINNLAPLCSYHGYVTGNLLTQSFIDTDIIILTSWSDGMPMTIMEALAFQIPCIVSRHTNVARIIQKYNCGWIAKMEEDDIANTILDAISDFRHNKSALRQNCLNAAESFSWDKIAAKSLQIYSHIINNADKSNQLPIS